jgi:hypothetical protein
VKPAALYPYTRNNPDLLGYGTVAAGTVVGFFAVVLLVRAFGDTTVPAPAATSPEIQPPSPSAGVTP